MFDLLLRFLGYLFVGYTLFACFIVCRYHYDDIIAKRHNCESPQREIDFPVGIRGTYETLRALYNNTILEFFHDRFDEIRTMRSTILGQRWMVTIEPENVKSILATSFKDYSLGFRYESFFPMLGNGIFTLSGEGWKHSRAMLRPQFSREQVSHLQSMKVHLNHLLDRFKEGSEDGKLVDAQVLFHKLTLDTATEFLFGTSANTLASESASVNGPRGPVSGNEFANAFTDSLLTLAARICVGPAYWAVTSKKFREDVALCHNFVDYFVYQALKNPMERGEEAERYVFINELTKETQDPVIIRDQAFNILLAGRDTTASLLSYCTYYLGSNKDILHKLREEILNSFGETDETVTFESLKRCKYLQNFINEVLRLHPIVPMNFRTAIRDTVLPTGGGRNQDKSVFVPKGTNVMYLPYVMQRHERYWGSDANEFKPDRWDTLDMHKHTWDYIPFNGGPRICLGQQFALTEASFALVRVLQTFKDINLVHPDPKADPRKLKQMMRLTSSVYGGVQCSFVLA